MKVSVDFAAIEPSLIPASFADSFAPTKRTLSDFEVQALCLFGDFIRSISSYDNVFVDNQYWWDDGNRRFSVYLTDNGILMYKAWDSDKLYRIGFNGNVSLAK
jgi:hypothetical protein